MKFAALLGIVAICLPELAYAGSTTSTLSIQISPPPPPPLVLAFTPPSPTVVCAAAAGTIVSTAAATGGDGNAITYTMTGTTDFLINSQTGAIAVVAGGIAVADCGKTQIVNVTASQS